LKPRQKGAEGSRGSNYPVWDASQHLI